MDVKYQCLECGKTTAATVRAGVPGDCLHCRHPWVAAPGDGPEGAIDQCLVCGCRHLFVRKDFPARLGAAIVIAGFLLSCVTWSLYLPIGTFAILFASAGLDLILYCCVGDMLVCYRCRAEYRRFAKHQDHQPFDLETAERYRQEQLRLKRS